MPDFATLRSRTGRAAAWVLIGLVLVVSPLAGLVTPYLIGLVGLLLLVAYLVTGHALRMFSGLAERAYLAAFGAITAAYALSAEAPGDMVYVANFSMLLVFAAMLHLFKDEARSGNDRLLSWLALGGLVMTVGMLRFQMAQSYDRPQGFNIGSIVLSNAAVALSVVAMLPLMRGRSWRDWRDLWLLVAPVMAVAIIMWTRSRGPLLAIPPLAVVTAFALWRTRYREVRWFPYAATVLIVGAGWFVLGATRRTRAGGILELVTELLSGGELTNRAAHARLVLQEAGLKAFTDSPWIGHGWAHLMDAVVPYLSAEDVEFARLPQLHNDVLNFAVSGGIVGIACYFAILVAPTIAAWRSVRDSLYATRLYGTSALMAVYAAAGLTDLMFGHEFHTAFFITLNAIILGMCRDAPAARPPVASPAS